MTRERKELPTKHAQEAENLIEEYKSLLDVSVFGTGIVKVTYDLERECIVKKRIDPREIKIDNG